MLEQLVASRPNVNFHAGSIAISQHDVAVAVVGQAEIHIWRGSPDPARQLEAVRGFVGRHTEVRQLHRWLRRRDHDAPVAAMMGGPGVGKTALPLLVANQLARRDYPDLQLQVRLPGDQAGAVTDRARRWHGCCSPLASSPTAFPRAPSSAPIATGRPQRPACAGTDRWRDQRSPGRAAAAPQGCATVVTTRAALGGVLEKGAEQLPLRTLSRDEALALLAARLGRIRLARQLWGAAHPAAADRSRALMTGRAAPAAPG